ncbi:HNH endonuclease signature motif containing protein [Gryllotalpicola koreensis]|uniref:HNH nuclease domain-containing protein n=1 Tax=Gryllotalpicola koreensis TaxID=993086 RepID=A0ABP8A5W5_9MICO
MSEIVSRVHSLTAAAAGALPCADEITALTDAAQLALLGELSALRREVDTAISLVASDIERKSARELGPESLARRAGVRSGAELVQRLTGSSLTDARKAVRVGGLLETAASVSPAEETDAPAEPRSIEALAALGGPWSAPIAVTVRNGWLPAEHADRITSGLGVPRDDASTPAYRQAVLRLIADCWDGELTPEDAARNAKATRAVLDREWATQNAQRLYEQRSLKRTVRSDGMVKYDLLVDPATDAQIWTPIRRHLAPRLGGPRFLTDEERARAEELQQDARTNEQLLADTFTAFLTAGITSSGVFGKHTPTVTIAVTTSELKKAITADAARRNSPPHDGPPGQPPGAASGTSTHRPPATPPPEDGIAWLDGTPHPLTGAQLITSLCDGSAAAALLDETGQTLDATKAERTFSTRQRRAMAIRDGGCLIPGCPMPPDATEAHHLNPWNERPQNRKTETKDGICLCRFHHLNLHNQGGHIERRGNTYWLHWPGREPTRLLPKHSLTTQLRTQGTIS